MLTKKQKKVLDYIQEYSQKNGFSPSYDEVRKHFKLSSVSTVNHYMKILQEKGYIKREKNAARSVEIKKKESLISIPFRGYIAAGQPIEAVEEQETIAVPKNLLSYSGKHFALGVKGDSMIDEGIFDGDTVIIRKQNSVEDGETAVALINGNEVTLKKIYKEKNRIRLQPANPKLTPFFVKSVVIQGKVISTFRNIEKKEKSYKNIITPLFGQIKDINTEVKKIRNFKDETEIVNKIIVGDCLEVMKKIKDNTFDMIFADPPYNMQLQNELYRPNNTKVDAVDDEWDQFKSFEHYDEFTKAWIKEAKRILKKNGTIWVIGSYHNIFRVGNIMQDLGYWILNDVHWIKANPMPNFKGVRLTNATETLVWAVKDKKVKNYTFNYNEMKKHNFGKQMRNDWYFAICNGAERLKDEKGVKVHSTQKPLPLLERIVLASTKKGDLVFDPFGGTCTTGVAAYKHGRNFTMVEKDENYVDW
ncbi:transcriptional repressor LexA, partial [Patescibacteria group bacterium]|nr:transcriptional repressor LexA [Patescibacteria group bacterium]